ncbi:MAG: hypothetical protein JWO12_545 [Frankiales bacterium]|nr:hypothetical protein [Frankiales bacterium]
MLLVGLLLAGCGNASVAARSEGPSSPPAAPTFSPSPLPGTVPESQACPNLEPEHLPSDQDTVTDAFICEQGARTVPGDGIWSFSSVKRLTSGLNELLRAYSKPDDTTQPPGGAVCSAVGTSPLTVWLHSDRGTSAVRATREVCGEPTKEAAAAYAALSTTVVSETKLQQVQSQLSIDSKCPEAYKDVLSLEEQDGRKQENSRTLPTPVSGRASVCTYTVEVDKDGDRVGRLTKHHDLDAEQLKTLNEALTHVKVDGTCSRHDQTGFALLDTGKPDPLFIALGGCAVQENHDWWRAGEDVRAAVS